MIEQRTIPLVAAFAVIGSLVLSGCTTTFYAEATGSTHSGTCDFAVDIRRNQPGRQFAVQHWGFKSRTSSGVTCEIEGMAQFSDGTTVQLPRIVNTARGIYFNTDRPNSALVKVRARWQARYYGQVQDSGWINYGT